MRVPVFASVAFLLAICAPGFAQDAVPSNLLDLIKGPDQVEIPCRIEFSKPQLMYQQQYVLQIRGEFSSKQIQRAEVQHLQVLMKVQDGQGQWLAAEGFEDYKIPQHSQKANVVYWALLYLRPGKYTVNLAIFDTETHKGNAYHHEIAIQALGEDPFPVIDQLLPEVQFPMRAVANKHSRSFWLLGDSMRNLDIPHSGPTRLDIVLNITDRFGSDTWYQWDAQRILEAGSVLGRFRPANGCVRVSVIDMLRLTVIADRLPAAQLSWTKLQKNIENNNQDVIDVHVLANQKKIAQFTHDYLDMLANDKAGCGALNGVSPLIVVISPDVVLPDGNKIKSMPPLPAESYVYVHMGFGGGWMDSMGQVLDTAKPKKLMCLNPREFRSALAKIAGMIATH